MNHWAPCLASPRPQRRPVPSRSGLRHSPRAGAHPSRRRHEAWTAEVLRSLRRHQPGYRLGRVHQHGLRKPRLPGQGLGDGYVILRRPCPRWASCGLLRSQWPPTLRLPEGGAASACLDEGVEIMHQPGRRGTPPRLPALSQRRDLPGRCRSSRRLRRWWIPAAGEEIRPCGSRPSTPATTPTSDGPRRLPRSRRSRRSCRRSGTDLRPITRVRSNYNVILAEYRQRGQGTANRLDEGPPAFAFGVPDNIAEARVAGLQRTALSSVL